MNFEKTITKTASLHIEGCWKWIARTEDGQVIFFTHKPFLNKGFIWHWDFDEDDKLSGNCDRVMCTMLEDFFQNVPWKKSLISVAAFRKKFEVK